MRFPWPIVATMLLCGCAANTPSAPTAHLAPTAIDRGRTFVQRACAGCHAIASGAQSVNRRAPPFWRLGRDMDDLQLRSALAAVSRHGHVEMPPIAIVGGELDDVARYIRSLPRPTDPAFGEEPAPAPGTPADG